MREEPRTILIASTSWWAFPARIAMAFAGRFRVAAICPPGHPLRCTRAVQDRHPYRALDPLGSLAAAIARARPALIVPCDDRVVCHLHALHARLQGSARPQDAAVVALIERSLGDPNGYAAADSRHELIRIACEAGVRAPEMRVVATSADLRAGLAEFGFPAILKVDGTWGGLGVVAVDSHAQAEQALQARLQRLTALRALKRLVVDRDAFHVRPWLARVSPVVNLQRFIRGRPANCVVACWQGEVLAAINVDVVNLQGAFGASTVVRVIEHPEMAEATRRLVRRLGMSGFCGLDFIIEEGTGHAHLIEMNPRGTPLCHLALGTGRDPVAALAARLAGLPQPQTAPVTRSDVIAFFPQAWQRAPQDPHLHDAYHDVPWEDPDLVRELVRLPWPDRGLLARLAHRLRRETVSRPQAQSQIQLPPETTPRLALHPVPHMASQPPDRTPDWAAPDRAAPDRAAPDRAALGMLPGRVAGVPLQDVAPAAETNIQARR